GFDPKRLDRVDPFLMLGRYLCGVTLYFLLAFIATVPLAARLWWVTGIATWQIVIAVLIQTFSFASLLSVAALASLPQKGVALRIMASAAVWLHRPFSPHSTSWEWQTGRRTS